MMTTMAVKAEEHQKKLIAEYAKLPGKSSSGFLLESALEKIEDDLDAKAWIEAKREFEENPAGKQFRKQRIALPRHRADIRKFSSDAKAPFPD